MDIDASKIDIIVRQTDYTPEVAKQKLIEFDNNEISVIREYLGGFSQSSSSRQVKSVNQEIYKQIRGYLNTAMNDYTVRQSLKTTQ